MNELVYLFANTLYFFFIAYFYGYMGKYYTNETLNKKLFYWSFLTITLTLFFFSYANLLKKTQESARAAALLELKAEGYVVPQK